MSGMGLLGADETPAEQAYLDKGEPLPEVEPAAPAPAPVAAPEPSQATHAPGKDQDAPTVPLAALHETRARLKEATERIQQEAEQRARMEARLAELAKRLEPPPPAPPDVETDPIGRIKYVDQQLAEMNKRAAEENQFRARQGEEQQFIAAYAAQVKGFMAEKPDYVDSFKHLRQNWTDELTDLGYSPEQIESQMLGFERAIVGKALADGINPAQRLYAAAKRRGYAGPQQPAEDKVATLNRGQQAAKSLSSAGGEAPVPDSLEAIIHLEGEEFDKAFERVVMRRTGNRIF